MRPVVAADIISIWCGAQEAIATHILFSVPDHTNCYALESGALYNPGKTFSTLQREHSASTFSVGDFVLPIASQKTSNFSCILLWLLVLFWTRSLWSETTFKPSEAWLNFKQPSKISFLPYRKHDTSSLQRLNAVMVTIIQKNINILWGQNKASSIPLFLFSKNKSRLVWPPTASVV